MQQEYWTLAGTTQWIERYVVSGDDVVADLNGVGDANTLKVRYVRGEAVDQLWARIDVPSNFTRAAGWHCPASACHALPHGCG